MAHLFEYRDATLYCHHSLDEHPDPADHAMHAHELYEVFFFLDGRGSYLVEGSEYPLSPGDIMVMRTAETHKLLIDPAHPYERVAFHFHPDILPRTDAVRTLLAPFEDRPLGQGNLYRPDELAEGPWRETLRDLSFASSVVVRAHLLGRLLMLLPVLADAAHLRAAAPQPPREGAGELVDYVNGHLFEDISLQSVSRTFFQSTSQVSRVFRRATGSSFWEYVTVKRLLAARAMLQRGEPAAATAAACGFSDYSAFFRAYKSRFGHAPRDERGQLTRD